METTTTASPQGNPPGDAAGAAPISADAANDVDGSGTTTTTPHVVVAVRNNKSVQVDAHAPSHWLADGHAVMLPPPTRLARRRWIERSIMEHGLLQSWTAATAGSGDDAAGKDDDGGNDAAAAISVEPEAKKEAQQQQQQQQIHPLALASERLQQDGINELNRSINLTSLVHNNEYFGLTNIVADAALELAAAASASRPAGAEGAANNEASGSGAGAAPGADTPRASNTAADGTSAAAAATAVAATAPTPQESLELQQSTAFQSLYVLKRKHGQFKQAAAVLRRHRLRLAGGLVADARPLRRLARLRHRWRLTAPEHGQRARAHPVRPDEVLAADVAAAAAQAAGAGRLARRIPRYATIELRKTPMARATTAMANEEGDAGDSNPKAKDADNAKALTIKAEDSSGPVPMEVDEDDKPEDTKSEAHKGSTSDKKEDDEGSDDDDDDDDEDDGMCWTYAEPFSLADPTLGKLDAEFDPSKIEMLTLQFALEDPITGKCVSACLEPTRPLSSATEPDEVVLMELQHSLLCATLFESMRRELADDTEEVGQIRTTSQQLYKNVVWLADSSGLAARPYLAAGKADRRALQVVHVHEGEVCVQLTARYTLRVQLVPASTKTAAQQEQERQDGETSKEEEAASAKLLLLCKTLLWQAHTLYHQHVVKQQKEADEEAAAKAGPDSKMPARPTTRPGASSSPHILQGCVHLGTKILMERKLRACFLDLQAWVRQVVPELPLQIETIPWSVLGAASMWALSLGQWQANILLEGGPRISLDWWSLDDSPEACRKVYFESLGPLSLFLERQLRLAIESQQERSSTNHNTVAENGHAAAEAAAAQTQVPPAEAAPAVFEC